MDLFSRFEQSPAHHPESQLPLCPDLNNPWIYAAYAIKLMRLEGLTEAQDALLKARIKAWAALCRIRFGLFDRWPGGRGGVFSHDEIMGMAYLSTDLARELILYLTEMDGRYCNKPEEVKPGFEDEFNVYRIRYVEPHLRACAPGFSVSLFTQLQYGIALVFDALTYKRGGESGRLKIWLTLGRLEKFWLSGFAIAFWRYRMKRAGITPKACFEVELKAYPLFAEVAPKEF